MAHLMRGNQESVFEICVVLSEQENLKVTLQEAGKGALLVGSCAFLGGLLGGPVGLAIGGSVTSIAVACTGRKYKSVVEILRNELTPIQKQRLINSMSQILGSIGPTDVASLLSIIISSATLKEAVLRELGCRMDILRAYIFGCPEDLPNWTYFKMSRIASGNSDEKWTSSGHSMLSGIWSL